ncbi:Solute-binding protein family 3 domain-containing protein, MltF-like [Desulfonema limicola]|uniref:Solute-binding protein family 3 domain-containing protein, MltF-like n=1 Tax=Desulfonema limicola TaxID=45656 RepID=A0A975GI56_9BACT|nr:ABC transporter substrate-binding protein [Desulfonema limicola]QTA82290.1 Solute-binding protein family 3 domain-containing protein, MltF-like [Desulfonema limicola]
MRKNHITGIAIILIFISCSYSFAEIIKVGGYVFPPFVEESQDEYRGITFDLIEEMNKFQNRFEFIFYLTSPKRRYQDFNGKAYDLMFFENIKWGWSNNKDIQASKVFLKGGEVYITKLSLSKDNSWFNSLEGKSIAGYLGYHYGFAGFNADETFLREKFNVKLGTSHEMNIQLVLRDRIDMAVITKSYLDKYIMQHPEIKKQIIISDKYDQIYEHTILVRKNLNLEVEDINILLDEMEKQGVLKKLWEKNGITY